MAPRGLMIRRQINQPNGATWHPVGIQLVKTDPTHTNQDLNKGPHGYKCNGLPLRHMLGIVLDMAEYIFKHYMMACF